MFLLLDMALVYFEYPELTSNIDNLTIWHYRFYQNLSSLTITARALYYRECMRSLVIYEKVLTKQSLFTPSCALRMGYIAIHHRRTFQVFPRMKNKNEIFFSIIVRFLQQHVSLNASAQIIELPDVSTCEVLRRNILRIRTFSTEQIPECDRRYQTSCESVITHGKCLSQGVQVAQLE